MASSVKRAADPASLSIIIVDSLWATSFAGTNVASNILDQLVDAKLCTYTNRAIEVTSAGITESALKYFIICATPRIREHVRGILLSVDNKITMD